MKNTHLIPRKGDDRDIGYRWSRGHSMQHYWRSRKGSSLAVAHCGKIGETGVLVDAPKFPKCTYCEFIENQREVYETGALDDIWDELQKSNDEETQKEMVEDFDVSEFSPDFDTNTYFLKTACCDCRDFPGCGH